MRFFAYSLAAALLFAVTAQKSAFAADGEALAQAKACFACHTVAAKVIGPAFAEVAAKYKGDSEAADKIVNQIKNGGVGQWGEIPMPPNPHLSDEDLQTLAAWILSL